MKRARQWKLTATKFKGQIPTQMMSDLEMRCGLNLEMDAGTDPQMGTTEMETEKNIEDS